MKRFGRIAAAGFYGALACLALGAVAAQAELGASQPGGPPGQVIRKAPPSAQRPAIVPQQQPQRFVRPAPVLSQPQPQPQPQVYRQRPAYQPPVIAYRQPDRRWEHRRHFRQPQVYFPPVPPPVYYPDPPVYAEPYPGYGDYTPAYRPRRSSVIANYCETEIDTCDIVGTMFVGRSCRCYLPGYGKVPGVAIE